MADFLRMSEATALGLHAAVLAAAEGGTVTTTRIAEELSASEAHLSKVLQVLARSGILESKRGPNGGYVLARPAAEITLLDVYEALEGEMRLGGCLFSRPVCDRERCIFGDLVERVRAGVSDYMRATTLEAAARHQGR